MTTTRMLTDVRLDQAVAATLTTGEPDEPTLRAMAIARLFDPEALTDGWYTEAWVRTYHEYERRYTAAVRTAQHTGAR